MSKKNVKIDSVGEAALALASVPFTRFNTQFANEPFEYTPESVKGLHKTLPSQTLSIPEMIKRFVSGQVVNGQPGEPQYFEEEVPNFDRMDHHELFVYANELQERINVSVREAAQAVLDAKSAKEKEQYQLDVQAAVQDELEKRKKGGSNEPQV